MRLPRAVERGYRRIRGLNTGRTNCCPAAAPTASPPCCGWGNRAQGTTQHQAPCDHGTSFPGSSKPTPCQFCPPEHSPPAGQEERAPGCSAPSPSRLKDVSEGRRGAGPKAPQEKRDCKGPARGQVQRSCWCLERQNPLGLAALSHHRDSQEIQLLQPCSPAETALTLWGPCASGTLPGGTELSLTFAVWSREAVAARAKGPPKPQHKSVMGRLCRDHTWRGSGIWEGSACSTLWGEQRGFTNSSGTRASS